MENFGNSDDWWMSTNSTIRFRESYETTERDQILRDAKGVDVAILSADLGMTPSHIKAYQRRLGLRTIAESNGRGTKRSALDTRGHKKKP
jgi:hypothetical protein